MPSRWTSAPASWRGCRPSARAPTCSPTEPRPGPRRGADPPGAEAALAGWTSYVAELGADATLAESARRSYAELASNYKAMKDLYVHPSQPADRYASRAAQLKGQHLRLIEALQKDLGFPVPREQLAALQAGPQADPPPDDLAQIVPRHARPRLRPFGLVPPPPAAAWGPRSAAVRAASTPPGRPARGPGPCSGSSRSRWRNTGGPSRSARPLTRYEPIAFVRGDARTTGRSRPLNPEGAPPLDDRSGSHVGNPGHRRRSACPGLNGETAG